MVTTRDLNLKSRVVLSFFINYRPTFFLARSIVLIEHHGDHGGCWPRASGRALLFLALVQAAIFHNYWLHGPAIERRSAVSHFKVLWSLKLRTTILCCRTRLELLRCSTFFFENERDDYNYLELICARTLGMLRHRRSGACKGARPSLAKKVIALCHLLLGGWMWNFVDLSWIQQRTLTIRRTCDQGQLPFTSLIYGLCVHHAW